MADETFTPEQTIAAIRDFLQFGDDAAADYYKGEGWAARCLRAHLNDLKAKLS